jgi:hypothetical protein
MPALAGRLRSRKLAAIERFAPANGIADLGGTGKREAIEVTDAKRLFRDAGRIVTHGSELPAATMLTLAYRLPILWATSPSAWQQAELWRMSLEKPLVLGHVWTALALSPLQVWLALARAWGPRGGATLPLELAALAPAALSDTIAPVHRRVTRNARRLSRRAARPRATRHH